MKKFIFVSFLLIFSTSIALSQSGWFWQNPNPVGSHLEDCYFVNDITGYAVGWDGVIIKTTNGGLNWAQLNSNTNAFLYSVNFVNAETGFVVSGDAGYSTNGRILKTTDSGLNWEISIFNNTGFVSVYFINEFTGFAAGIYSYSSGILFKTVNSGVNWFQIVNIPPSFFSDIHFLNENTGYISNEQSFLKTTNCGISWLEIGKGQVIGIQNIYFTSIDTGYAVGYYGRVFKTENGGVNWILRELNPSTHLWNISFINDETGYIVGGGTLQNTEGRIYKTTNRGNTWDSLNFGDNSNVVGLSLLNDSVLISVGYWGKVIKSSNYGINWSVVSNGNTSHSYNHILFTPSSTGYISGSSGLILKSTNLGLNWFQLSTNTNYDLKKGYFVNSQTGYAIGNSGLLIKTTNEGSSWVSLNTGTNYNLNDIQFVNPQSGFIICYYTAQILPPYYGGKILKTTTSGVSWTEILNRNFHLYSCYFINENTGFVSASNSTSQGRILRTTDGGINWDLILTPNNSVTSCFYFLNSNTGFAGGRIGEQWASYSLLKTTNSGINWTEINIPIPYDFYVNAIYFSNSLTGYLTCLSFPDYGRAGDIFKTIDGGNTWFHFSTFPSYPSVQRRGLNSVSFINENTGFIVGEKGIILKTTDGGSIIGLNTSFSSQIPESFTLHQNYPNPFNPLTKIRFDIPRLSNAKIIIYDLLGREITTLVNEQLKPGIYEVDWDGSNYASGVYFYSLVTDEFTETKRMVLIK